VIKEYPGISMVRIELTRELNDKNRRMAIRRWNKRMEDEREKARKMISEYQSAVPVTEENLLKYKLWKELQEVNGSHECPYTGKSISFSDLFLHNRFQVEHIVPRSRSWSDAEVNLTLCESGFNTDIKKDALPFEIRHVTDYGYNRNWTGPNNTKTGKEYYDYQPLLPWKFKAEGLRKEIEIIEDKIKSMGPGDARDRLLQEKYLKSFERNYYKGKYHRFTAKGATDIEEEDMVKNLLTDTGYITRLAALYLKSYFGNDRVETVKGATTTMLREEWDLGDKNRGNHYHHAEDAVVIALTNLNRYRGLALHRKKEKSKGRFALPWPSFKDDFYSIISGIMVQAKNRHRKIVAYNKTVVHRGAKQKMRIQAVRGEIHKANPYGKIKFKGDVKFTSRTEFSRLSEQDRKTNLPASLKWQPLNAKTEERIVNRVLLEGIEKPVPLAKLTLQQVALVLNAAVKDEIENRLANYKGEAIMETQPLPLFIIKDLKESVEAKGAGQIKKCEVRVIVKGKEKLENRKLLLVDSGKLLRFNEVPLITDVEIKETVINRLRQFADEPERLSKEVGEADAKTLIQNIADGFFDLDMALPKLFFEKKLQRSLNNYGVPVRKATLHIPAENGIRKYRKAVSALCFEDIPYLTQPVQNLLVNLLEDAGMAYENTTGVIPTAITGSLFVPVKHVRTHNNANLYPIRPGAYFSFGNTDHVKVYLDQAAWGDKKEPEIFVDPVPFYFVLNPSKAAQRYDSSMQQRIASARLQMILKKGDYVILNLHESLVDAAIGKGEYFRLKDNLYRVAMIFSGGFDIKFKPHYSAKGDEDSVNIKSSGAWIRANPIRVSVSATGKLSKL
jgi:hypothetical protein